ncbi:MAG: cyclic nucleotide-binding domain-containing protein, partial [Proteobacteria bacterium]|nr:cyclic nucleotide-binding domain-containing protein [Pseudomonadota bacterium]
APGSPPIRTHVYVGLATAAFAFLHTIAMITELGSPAATAGGMLAVSHAGRDRRARRDHFLAQNLYKQQVSRSNWEILTYLGSVNVIGEAHFLRNTDSAVAVCEKHLATMLSDDNETKELLNLSSSLIQALDRSMLRRLRSYWMRMAYAPGELIFAQESAANGVFFVTSGRVDVMVSVPGTVHMRKLQSLTSGAVFGEMALIDNTPRVNSIVAAEPTTCYWISSENFGRLKTEQTDIALAMLANVALIFVERLRATDTMLADMEA